MGADGPDHPLPAGPIVRLAAGWRALGKRLGDAGRFPWAALYWNGRKTLYVRRGRSGACPCHDPSDSGEPGATRCMAASGWNDPGRFRRICPLLVRTDQGWRCSVAPGQVRPFWGRLAAWVALAFGLLYVVGAGVSFALIRRAGLAEVRLGDVFWPGHWSRIPAARARQFRDRGLEAARRGDVSTALLSLASAWRTDPGDYETGLLLARLESAAGVYAFSDQHFADLIERFPAQAARTTLVWHDQLLAGGQWRELTEFCRKRLRDGGPLALLLRRSLVFALQNGRDAGEFLGRHEAVLRRTDPALADLLAVLAAWQAGDISRARTMLALAASPAASPLVLRFRVEWLAAWGDTAQANAELTRHAARLGASETAALQYRVSAASGDALMRRADFRRLWRTLPDEAELDRIFSLIIATGDRDALRETAAQLPRLPAKRLGPARANCWLAAMACGDNGLAAGLADAVPPATLRAGELVARRGWNARNQGARSTGAFLINTLPLGRETAYALLAGGAHAAP